MLIIDAQLSPHLAIWIQEQFGLDSYSVQYLGLREAEDLEIFMEARRLDAIVLTKDEDFVQLLNQKGSPPKVIWITCGNTSNQRMREILSSQLQIALDLLKTTDLVEITD
jgi:predicted nuclease of predicted toxin-antitoxin system